MKKTALLIALMAIAGTVNAATVINANIAGTVTWTKTGNPYHLVGDIYVLPGADLTIEAGVIVASFYDDFGSLAVSQGAKIHVMGTQQEPVIMTSAEDVATWAGSVVVRGGTTLPDGNPSVSVITQLGDPKTGEWRPVCNEWGSLAIMGKGYISASHYGGNPVTWDDGTGPYTNTKCPQALNKKEMEGLVNQTGTDPEILYGGDDDNDDSGEIHYLSLRYGGRDTQPQKELNGLSLGAIGRATDVDHVEVMNNVDDGIEIWGGTVVVKNANIWNIGDDSFDCDEGWRGCAKYGLIVQGYCRTTHKQGSGVGDNAFEIDGAEDADAQPMTTARISNFTVVGQPGKVPAFGDGSDGSTTWRDNARVQYDSCIWMDLDDESILFDNADTDGASGYDGTATDGNQGSKLKENDPADGTMNWVQHWTTSYNDWKISGEYNPNGCNTATLDAVYAYICSEYDLSAPLCNITNSYFYGSNIKRNEYDFLDGKGADLSGNTIDQAEANQPIQNVVRGAAVNIIQGGKLHGMEPVEFINPLPVTAVTTAGGFNTCNWLSGWTAADAFGMTDTSMNAGSADLDCNNSTVLEDLASFSSQWLN